MNGGRFAELESRPSFAVAYASVRDAYLDLEHALECHEPIAAKEAAFDWWRSLQRLRSAS